MKLSLATDNKYVHVRLMFRLSIRSGINGWFMSTVVGKISVGLTELCRLEHTVQCQEKYVGPFLSMGFHGLGVLSLQLGRLPIHSILSHQHMLSCTYVTLVDKHANNRSQVGHSRHDCFQKAISSWRGKTQCQVYLIRRQKGLFPLFWIYRIKFQPVSKVPQLTWKLLIWPSFRYFRQALTFLCEEYIESQVRNGFGVSFNSYVPLRWYYANGSTEDMWNAKSTA